MSPTHSHKYQNVEKAELRENLEHLLSSSSLFFLKLVSARRECNFHVLSRARTERLFIPLNNSLPSAVGAQGSKAKIRQHLCQLSEPLGHPACHRHQKEFCLSHLLSHCYYAGYFKAILSTQQLTKSLLQNKSGRWSSGLCPRTAERELSYLSVDWIIGHGWAGSGWGTMSNFWGPCKVSLLNGASEFCGKEVSDIVLFNQKSWDTNAFHIIQTSVPHPEECAKGNRQLLVMTHESNHHLRLKCLYFKSNPNTL